MTSGSILKKRARLPMDGSGFPGTSGAGYSDYGQPSYQGVTPELMSLIMQMQQTGQLNPPPSQSFARGSWTAAEDEMLAQAVGQLGPKRWTDVARFVPSRTSKQCRERWFNRLCPEIKHEPFEPWEDQIIIERQKELGNRWSLIARMLPGRSTNAIKNRWYSGLKSEHELNVRLEMRPLDPGSFRGYGSDFMSLGRGFANRGDEHEGDLSNTDL
jgi:hypothetical protein